MWPNRVADGSTRTTTPGILSDVREVEIEEAVNTNGGGVVFSVSSNNDTNESSSTNNHMNSSSNPFNPSQTTSIDEFPILDELDRLAKVFVLLTFKEL